MIINGNNFVDSFSKISEVNLKNSVDRSIFLVLDDFVQCLTKCSIVKYHVLKY
jgi:hypothetical protein